MTSDIVRFQVPRSWFWAVAYVSALAALVADANIDLLDDPWHWMLKLLVVILVVPLLVSSRRQAEEEGPTSPAFTTFNHRMLAAAGACILVFAIGAGAFRALPPESAWLWPLGLVTAVPLLFMIWAMGRYLAEETDEYLRHLATMSALVGLAAVLVLATVWGFLENLGLVPHVWAWWLVPIFGLSNGIGRAWLKAQNR